MRDSSNVTARRSSILLLLRRVLFIALLISMLVAATQTGQIELRVGGKKVETSPPSPVREMRVLFVGNSLTYYNEMPWLAAQVAQSLGVKPPLRAHFSGAGGMTLRQQWERGRAVTAIREGKYDYVVLQPQSSEIVRTTAETFRYARLLAKEIQQSGAKPMVFLTWAPRTGSFTQREYNEKYQKLGAELGAVVVPVGIAWQALLNQKIELFDGSGVHPNLAGSYLTACTFVAAIYGRSVRGAAHTFDVHFDIPESSRKSLETERLSADTAKKIQDEAWRVVGK